MVLPSDRIIGEVLAIFDLLGCRFALVGGLAVSIRSDRRFTKDIDFSVLVATDKEAEQIIYRFQSSGFIVTSLLENKKLNRISTIRLQTPEASNTDPDFDLLFFASGIEDLITHHADILPIIPHKKGPVATIGHLIAMKTLSFDEIKRPQDLIDIGNLLRIATEKDLFLAREAVKKIDLSQINTLRICTNELEKLIIRYRKIY